MAQYGEVLDSSYDPTKDYVYNLFVHYFSDPVMRKMKDIGNYSMYVSKIHALLGIEHRYVIAFIFKDEDEIGKEHPLSNLKWLSLQTRTLEDDHDLPFHSYIPKRLQGLDKKIRLVQKNEGGYIYETSELPITVTLLPKSRGFDYSESGSVIKAIETYQTIINFV